MGSEPPAFYGELTGMQLPHTKAKPPPMVLTSDVTLVELANSATIKVTYTRKKLKPDGMVRAARTHAHTHARHPAPPRATRPVAAASAPS